MPFFGNDETTLAESDTADPYEFRLLRQDSLDTLENYLVEHQRGPGRTLNKFNTFLGRCLEDMLEMYARHRGITPQAREKQIRDLLATENKQRNWWEQERGVSRLDTVDPEVLCVLCKNLLKCIK